MPDTIWFKSTTTLQASTIAQNALLVMSVPANVTYVSKGPVPTDASLRLEGMVEHITVHSATSTARNLDVIFFSGATAIEATGSADRYIDHESFVAADWWQVGGAGARRTAKSDLAIPYVDKDKTKIFHIGILNRHTSSIEAKSVVIEFSWRSDRGD